MARRMQWPQFNGRRMAYYSSLLGEMRGEHPVSEAISWEWERYKEGTRYAQLDALDALDAVAGHGSMGHTHTQEDRIMSDHDDTETRIIGGQRLVRTRQLAIPIVDDGGEISDDAAWDMAEGVLDYLVGESTSLDRASAMRQRASAIKRRVRGEGDTRGDQLEYELGQKIGEMLMLVALDRGLSAEQWLGLMIDLLDPAPALGIQPVDPPVGLGQTRRPSILDRLRTSPAARQLTDDAGRAGARVVGEAARRTAGDRFGPALGQAAGAFVEGTANSVVDLLTGGNESSN